MTTPTCMIAIKNLLHGQTLHLSSFQENITVNGIDCSVSPRGWTGGQVVCHGRNCTVFDPVDVIRDVLCVQSCIMVRHVMVVFEVTDDAAAQKLVSLSISPVWVSIVTEEVGVKLGIELSDKRLCLAELLHTTVVLLEWMCMLVEESCELHVLIVK